ncbi:sulfate adenylyltransferase subunit 1 [Citrobacter freundii]|nr:sulfate adenylyltransferase subunit 1 [Citrobacter freundii]
MVIYSKRMRVKRSPLVLKDEIDISRGDLLLDAGEALPAVQSAAVDVVWMAEQPLSPGQSYDIKVAGKKTRARVDNVQYQIDINNLTQRAVEALPLNGIGLVNLTFDEPLVLDTYQQNPVTGGLIIIDRLTNVTVGAGLVREPIVQDLAAASQFSAFELELNALVRRHFPHWDARESAGRKIMALHDENVVWHAHPVTPQQREQRHGHRGVVLWFTGLSWLR